MDKWLVKRLTKERRESPVWYELADVLEEFWDTYFSPEADRLDAAKSLFTASAEDLDRRLAELGDFFDVHLPLADSSKPLAVAWRQIEIHDKDAASIIDSILDRNFPELHARWEIMYCPLNSEYKYENLYSQTEIEISRGHIDPDLNNYMMTSRGRLWVDYRQMQQVYPHLTKEEFLAVVRSEIEKVKPVHIVYDGELFLLYIDWIHARLPYEIRDRLTTRDLIHSYYNQHDSNQVRDQFRELEQMDYERHEKELDRNLTRDAFEHDHYQLSHTQDRTITRDNSAYHYQYDTEHDRVIARRADYQHRATGRYRDFIGFDEIPCDYSPLDLHYNGNLT